MIPRVGKLALSGLMVVVMPGSLFGGGNRQDARSNVLFIMSDNHTTQAIGAYGSPLARLNPTPNIDSLAKGGMRLGNETAIHRRSK